jgi:two-component system, OmpR family, phosphate regulon sensor histidine kinase PhoR
MRTGNDAGVTSHHSVVYYALIGVAVQVAFLAGAVSFVVVGAASQGSAITAAAQVSQLELTNQALREAFLDAQRDLRGYQITREDRFLLSYYTDRLAYAVTLRQARLEALPAVLADLQRAARTAVTAFRLADAVAADPRRAELFDQATVQSDLFVSQSKQMAAKLERSQAALNATSHQALGIGLGASVIILIIGSVVPVASVAFLTSRTIGPLRATTQTVRKLAAGDTSARTVPAGPAETRQLAASINHLADENDRLRALEEQRTYLKEVMRDTAARIREHLRAGAIASAAVANLTGRRICDQAWVALIHAGRLAFADGEGVDDELAAVLPWDITPGDAAYDRIAEMYRERANWHDDLRSMQVEGFDPALRQALLDMGGVYLLVVPFGTGAEPQGVLCLLRNDPGRPWTATEAAEIQPLAADIGRGFDHARMYQAEEELVEKLRAVDRARASFLASASHDVQTPLTSIQGYVEMLADGDFGPLSEPQATALSAIGNGTQRLRGLIQDMLTMSKIELGVFRSALRPEDLARLTSAAADTIRPVAHGRRITLEASCSEPRLLVNADAGQLDRALVNLLSNAVKYSPEGGEVTLTATREGSAAVVRVADAGIGIPEEEQGSLFTPFFRASNAAASTIPGTGLGLSIVATIIENHHGDISLRSAPGTGTTVTVRIPLLVPQQRAPGTGQGSPAASASAPGTARTSGTG